MTGAKRLSSAARWVLPALLSAAMVSGVAILSAPEAYASNRSINLKARSLYGLANPALPSHARTHVWSHDAGPIVNRPMINVPTSKALKSNIAGARKWRSGGDGDLRVRVGSPPQ